MAGPPGLIVAEETSSLREGIRVFLEDSSERDLQAHFNDPIQ